MALITLNTENFDDIVHANELVVVDFWAKWCGPCLAFTPIFEKVSHFFPEVIFAQVDIEESPALANDFNIRSVPMLMILKKDIVVFAESGTHTMEALSELVKSAKTLDVSQVLSEIKKNNAEN